MNREQMITHLILSGWGPCGTASTHFNFPRLANIQTTRVMLLGLHGLRGATEAPLYSAQDLPDNDWSRYSLGELRKFVAALDVELVVELDL